MFIKLPSAAVNGLECLPVDVEVDIAKGQTNFTIVGLADTSIKEARDRIHSALKNSSFTYPFNFRIVINLAPADIAKEGPAYDLPMAVGIITLSNSIEANITDTLIVGELGLDGSVRHITGVLPLVLYAKEHGLKHVFVPAVDAPEAAVVDGITVYPVEHLRAMINHLTGEAPIPPFVLPAVSAEHFYQYEADLNLVKGQEYAKRALEIAASGGHNLLMSGPPGSGKTLLARTLPSILPPLTMNEALEVSKIYSVAGLLKGSIMRARPFRTPHHTASGAALVGGGRVPRPGEISLAHRGVLFLDEFPEFPRFVIESLRQPLEDGIITVARAQGTVLFPARFMLVASLNPCPCGFATDPDQACTCSPQQKLRYKKKLSGPLLDRIDLQIEVPRVKFEKLTSNDATESSATVRERVARARAIQAKRFAGTKLQTNSDMGNRELKTFCQLDDATLTMLKTALTHFHLSARAYNRILKVARTIADLAESETITTEHVAEALQLRTRQE
jgi:magnesium chelatase family protein